MTNSQTYLTPSALPDQSGVDLGMAVRHCRHPVWLLVGLAIVGVAFETVAAERPLPALTAADTGTDPLHDLGRYLAQPVEGYAGPAADGVDMVRDFGSHATQQDSWHLYGHLKDENGQAFGFNLVMVRSGLQPPLPAAATTNPGGRTSAWRANDVYLAQWEWADMNARHLHRHRRAERAALGLSGTDFGTRNRPGETAHVWVAGWELTLADGIVSVCARVDDRELAFAARLKSPPLSTADTAVGASSVRGFTLSRLPAEGQFKVHDTSTRVHGTVWVERYWGRLPASLGVMQSSHFGLALADGRNLLLRVLQRNNGMGRPILRGEIIAPAGTVQALEASAMQVRVSDDGRTSEHSGNYPHAWELKSAHDHWRVERVRFDSESGPRSPVNSHSSPVRVYDLNDNAKLSGEGYVHLLGFPEG